MIDLAEEDIVFLPEPHEYVVRGSKVPSVTQVIAAAGLGEDFSLVPPDVLRMAQQRGNAVHIACAYLDSGELDWSTVDDRIKGYVRAYQLFRAKLPIKTVVVEKRMAGLLYWTIPETGEGSFLAGTPDLIAFVNGRRSVIDIKTGQNAGAGLQTAGYKLLWDAAHPNALIYNRYSLKLRKDGTYKLVPEEDPDDVPAFLDAMEYADAKKKMGRWTEKYR